LRTPDQSYLAQRKPTVSLVDLPPEAGGHLRQELVLSTPNDLAFFRLTRDPTPTPSDNPPLYQCVGFFRSPDGVSFDPATLEVGVTSRAGYERSQLVLRHYYRPVGDGYFVAGTTTLVPPFTAGIDFAAGIPSDVLDTPYPEKIVLAFYKTLGRETPQPAPVECLSAQAQVEWQQGRLAFGSPFPQDQVKFAVVKELSYYPTAEGAQSTVVTVRVQFRSTSDADSAVVDVRWTVIREDGRWKMDFPQL
jgi:hypothetical protein